MGKIFDDVIFAITKNGEVIHPTVAKDGFKRYKDAKKYIGVYGGGCKISLCGLIYNDRGGLADFAILKKNIKRECGDEKIGFEVFYHCGCVDDVAKEVTFSTYKKAKKAMKDCIKYDKKNLNKDDRSKYRIGLVGDDDGACRVIKENVSSTKKALKKLKDKDDDYER